jgi:hypothetical protein
VKPSSLGRSIAFLWVLGFLLLATASIGAGRALVHRPRPEVQVWIEPTPVPVDVTLLSSLLDFNERAGGLAGYPALAEPSLRRDVAGQAAAKIGELALETGESDDPYAARQTAILEEMGNGLRAYAQGEGAARLGAASAENAALREELARLLANGPQ